MSLGENIKTYRKSKGHSMADVSQLTGIPADRIYKWEKGTKPNDAEDLLKIQSYLRGELETIANPNLETIPKNKPEPTPMQILDRLSQAFIEQAKALADQAEGFKAQAEAFKAQGELMKSMALQADQLSIKEKVLAIEDRTNEIDLSLGQAQRDVTTLLERQESAIEEFRDQFLVLKEGKSAPSKGARKKLGQNDGND